MPNLACTCGCEPTIYIDASQGPGLLCHIACNCGARGNACWDVVVPWADLIDDWNNPIEADLRSALKMGMVTRDAAGRYAITVFGATIVSALAC